MAIFEKYVGGRLVERVQLVDEVGQPLPGKEAARVRALVEAREHAGEVDGWYREGEYAAAEAQRVAVQERTVGEVLADVGDDPARALVALRAEMGRDKPRKSLVAKLQELAEPLLAAESGPDDENPEYAGEQPATDGQEG